MTNFISDIAKDIISGIFVTIILYFLTKVVKKQLSISILDSIKIHGKSIQIINLPTLESPTYYFRKPRFRSITFCVVISILLISLDFISSPISQIQFLPDKESKSYDITNRADFILDDAKHKAEEIIGNAQNEANHILYRASEEAKRFIDNNQKELAKSQYKIAEQEANRILQDAHKYSDDILRNAKIRAEKIYFEGDQIFLNENEENTQPFIDFEAIFISIFRGLLLFALISIMSRLWQQPYSNLQGVLSTIIVSGIIGLFAHSALLFVFQLLLPFILVLIFIISSQNSELRVSEILFNGFYNLYNRFGIIIIILIVELAIIIGLVLLSIPITDYLLKRQKEYADLTHIIFLGIDDIYRKLGLVYSSILGLELSRSFFTAIFYSMHCREKTK